MLKFFKIIFFIQLLLVPINAWSEEKLIFAIDIIRHGDRTPIYIIPASPPYHWKGRGQLTPKGMQQQYQLGKQLHKKYIEQYHLLPAQYNGETMYVRSSDYDRTRMSVQSLLAGLYPLEAIPIHTMPQKQDRFLIPRRDRQKFKALLQQYVFPRAEWKEKNAQLQNKYPAWSKATGVKITNLYQLSSIGNALYISQLHHAPLPKDLSPTDVKEIIAAGKWATVAAFKPKEVGKATGNDLLVMITNYLRQAMKHESPLKYLLISGHDATILSVMSAMHVPLTEPPNYAADLNFALYEISPAKYILKITYNNQQVIIPVCSGPICTMQQFNTLLN